MGFVKEVSYVGSGIILGLGLKLIFEGTGVTPPENLQDILEVLQNTSHLVPLITWGVLRVVGVMSGNRESTGDGQNKGSSNVYGYIWRKLDEDSDLT
jgi:hypothetical protein